MTNASCLLGSYITAGPVCLCLTNRLCVLKQPRMARVMTNCVNKTFITLNILATKSQLPRSASEHPAPLPHSYSSHTTSPMHKLAFFCHIGGLAGWELAQFVLRVMRRGALMADECKKLLWWQINRSCFHFHPACICTHQCVCVSGG